MRSAVLDVNIPGLADRRSGKVREVFDLGQQLLIVATDRLSAFDVIMANGVPDKGRVLNQMSAFWFERFANLCPNHVVSTDDAVIRAAVEAETGPIENWEALGLAGRCTLATKTRPIPIECVVRGYITGSLLKDYRREGPSVFGLCLPENLQDGSKLSSPIFTPATKAGTGHDETISEAEAMNRVGVAHYKLIRDWSMEIYAEASVYALSKGIILADTKFEFGVLDDGPIWIDEALTPDSSRFWPMSEYQVGQTQPSLDKQFVRNYLESIPWNKQPPGPVLPEDIIEKTREIYLDIFRKLTGSTLDA